MQIEVPANHTVAIRKTGMAVDVTTWPAVSLQKVFAYGLQQILNDAAAPAKTPDEVAAFVAKRLDNLRAGVLRASTTRIGDPVEKAARAIAREKVLAAIAKLGVPAKGQPIAQMVTDMLAKYPAIRATAKANVELAASLGEIEVDVGDLDDDADEGDDY